MKMPPVPGQVGDEDHGLVANVEGDVREGGDRRPPLATQDLHAWYPEVITYIEVYYFRSSNETICYKSYLFL